MNGTPWTKSEIRLLKARFPHESTRAVAERLGRSVSTVNNAAARLGLRKTPEYLASPAACRLRRGDNVGAATRFKKGHTPANKGLRSPGWAPGRMSETQFKKGARQGAAAENWRPIGTIRQDPEGYLRIKVREGRKGEAYGFGNTEIWPLLNRYNWVQNNGPIPPGHTVVFKDGNRAHCEIENLELISRAELMKRNTIHNYPPDLKSAIMMLGAVKRKLRENAEKNNDRSSQPSV